MPHKPALSQVRRSDVLSTWSGIRPLATDPNAHDTASASRDHVATVDPDGLLTITGPPVPGLMQSTLSMGQHAATAYGPCPCMLRQPGLIQEQGLPPLSIH